MSAEIEKKFLLPAFPGSELENQEIKLVSKQYIYQTYLAFSEDQEIRVRQLVDSSGESHFTHTFKSGHGMVREEIEYNISETVYKQLLDHTGLIPLEKIRTTVEHAGLYFEIDEYKQVDLAVVEVEFPSIEAAERFVAPAWFGRELGSEDEFRNKSMWVALQKSQPWGIRAHLKEGYLILDIRRLGEQDVPKVQALMVDVVSRLPSTLYSMDRLEGLYEKVEQKGEMYGAYQGDTLVAYTVLAFPGLSASNLGREFGVPEAELHRVASLEGTIVHESARGQGLQRHFHAWREQRAREKDMLYIYATVHPDNVISRRNLESAGLTLQFSRPMYGGLPRQCYAKKLL